MAHCINISHPEVGKLAEELKLPKIVISAKIAVWQFKTKNLERFPTAKELGQTIIQQSKEEKVFSPQEKFFNKRIATLERQLKNDPKNTQIQKELDFIKERFEKAVANQDKDIFKELGEHTLSRAEAFIKELEEGKRQETDDNLMYVINTLDVWNEFKGLRDKTSELYDRALPFIKDFTVKQVNGNKTETEEITREDIDSQKQDIGTFRMSTGALVDVSNYVARTIGSIIRKAQNRVETKNKALKREIEVEVNLLAEYAKKNGVNLQSIYNNLIFIDEKGHTRLIQVPVKSLPKEEARFYEFYQTVIDKLQDELPYYQGNTFIPNLKNKSLKEKLKGLSPFKTRKLAEDTRAQELKSDLVPLDYLNDLDVSEKSSDLGALLLEFGQFANNYSEMSNILPTVRILQEEIKNKDYVTSSNPNATIEGTKSNLYKLVNGFIEAQVKGATKKEQGKFHRSFIYDEEGNPIEEKFFDATSLADNLLSFNSLLRIGFSPITATANWLFGDISNIIESIGSKFFSFKNLKDATNIFFKQNLNKESVLNQLLEELNPLQELDDYQYIEALRAGNATKKMSPEKLKEYAYYMQKTGEKFLQSRTMLAIMIKDDYLTPKGELTDKGKFLVEKDNKKLSPEQLKEREQLADKIQRLNQMIHGRYTTKEAAIAQQNVLYRLVSQFRKWIPAAIEARLGDKQYDVRLQTEIEGRYRTLARLIGSKDILNNLIKMSKGELSETEMYNMKKNLVELVLLLATITLGMMGSGDDDKSRRMRKNAYWKTTMTLLNRVQGDISFWYSPSQLNNLGKNALPISKTIDDLIQATFIIPKALYSGDYYYSKGSHKGQSKILKEIGDVTPFARPIQDLFRLGNKQELEELR